MSLRLLIVAALATGMLLGCAEEATYQTPPLPPPPPPPPTVQPEATPEPYTQQAPVTSSEAATSAQPPAPPSAPPPPPPGDDGTSASQGPPPAAPSSDQLVYSYPSGSWVYIVDRGWVWIPAGATTVDTDGTPYVYLYTPAYGWTWYLSPWGPGPYRYGVWIHHPWHPYGWHGYWVAHPRVVVRLGGHPHYYSHRR